MKCPLLNRVNYTQATELGYEVGDCLKEECAWWDNIPGKCSILSLSRNLFDVRAVLDEIKERMPHEEQ